MAIYMPEYRGYIADVPNVLFERCDGKRYYYDELDSCSVTQNHDTLTINGGQSNFPLALIDTTSTFEVQMSSAQFTLDMFEMSNGATVDTGDIGVLDGGIYAVDSNLKITLPFEVKANSVKITGMEEASAVAAGKFKVTLTASAAATAGKTEIEFNTGDVTEGDNVPVTFIRRVVNGSIVEIKTNSTTARGSMTLAWPVYSSGTDCTEAAEKGRLMLEISRVRVTALPGFSNSYKGASTNAITVTAMDPKRGDKRVARYIYEQYDSDGEIVNKSSGTVDWT